jgi:hypothetical protein
MREITNFNKNHDHFLNFPLFDSTTSNSLKAESQVFSLKIFILALNLPDAATEDSSTIHPQPPTFTAGLDI